MLAFIAGYSNVYSAEKQLSISKVLGLRQVDEIDRFCQPKKFGAGFGAIAAVGVGGLLKAFGSETTASIGLGVGAGAAAGYFAHQYCKGKIADLDEIDNRQHEGFNLTACNQFVKELDTIPSSDRVIQFKDQRLGVISGGAFEVDAQLRIYDASKLKKDQSEVKEGKDVDAIDPLSKFHCFEFEKKIDKLIKKNSWFRIVIGQKNTIILDDLKQNSDNILVALGMLSTVANNSWYRINFDPKNKKFVVAKKEDGAGSSSK